MVIMKKTLFFVFAFFILFNCTAQYTGYIDSIQLFRNNYVQHHELIKGGDKKKLIFYPINQSYAIQAKFERVYSSSWFQMETSGKIKQTHRIYGNLLFSVNDTVVKLAVYQSQSLMNVKQYADYLFVPFTDATTGETTYENGRYIDLKFGDIKNNSCIIDFNKAYNPYCAYVSGVFNCPIPPKENNLPAAIAAGEMKFAQH
jgi:uncharacterized protein